MTDHAFLAEFNGTPCVAAHNGFWRLFEGKVRRSMLLSLQPTR
jgi:hypothetical protein